MHGVTSVAAVYGTTAATAAAVAGETAPSGGRAVRRCKLRWAPQLASTAAA
eukprot:COSAG06_NODE_54563_length_294_cov_0.533333_1_plen_50_part_10